MAISVEKIGFHQEADEASRRKKWTVDEYYRLAEIGVFDQGLNQERVELIDGDVYRLHPASEDEHLRRWTTDEYYKMYEAGLFDGQRVELIDGEILVMSPMAQPHAICVMKTNAIFVRQMPPHLMVRTQMPLLVLGSEPEPDIAIVEREVAFDLSRKPTTAALVIEVSDSTLKGDQTTKMSLYAAADIPEYWILNLRDRRLEVHSEPIEDSGHLHGFRYGTMRTLKEAHEIAPLCAPELVLKVVDLLP